MIRNFLLALLMISATHSLAQQGRDNAAGMKTVRNASWGVSFRIPEPLKCRQDGERYIITGPLNNEVFIVARHELSTKKDLITAFKTWKDGDLRPSGTMYDDLGNSAIGCKLRGTYNNVVVNGYGVSCIHPRGGKGISMIILISERALTKADENFVTSTLSTVTFAEAPVSAPSDMPEWREKVSGKMLHYRDYYSSNTSGGGGYHNERKIRLRPDQSFNYFWESYIYGPAMREDKDNGNGSWRIARNNSGQPVLELNFDDGRQKNFVMSQQGSLIYLDGRKYYIEQL